MPLLLADSGLLLVFQMASVDKSTVPPRDTLLVLLYRRALMQKERRMRMVKLSARIFDTRIWSSVMTREGSVKAGKEYFLLS